MNLHSHANSSYYQFINLPDYIPGIIQRKYINNFSITMADFITMADKIIASISYIRTVSKKKATIEKILAHLSKSEICNKRWSTESLKVLLSDMTARNQIEFVDSGYKIKQNKAQDDNDNEAQDDNDDNCNLLKTPKSVRIFCFG